MDLTKYKECRAHKQWIFVGNNTNTPYRPCCWFRTSIQAATPEEYWQKLETLDIETNCSYCIKMEEKDGGDWSARTLFNNYTDDDTLVITASFDNFCNLKCVTCSPENSTQIAIEMDDTAAYNGKNKRELTRITKYAPVKSEFMKEAIRNTKYSKLRFELLGGEPLINPVVFEFLDWLAEQPIAKETSLCITTNGTTFSDKVAHYTTKFNLVTLQFSIDGTGEVFEYIRSNSVDSVMNENLDKFYKLSEEINNLHITFNFTLSWMNCMNFADFLNWVTTKYPKTAMMLVTKLEGPQHYAVEILPTTLKKEIVDLAEKKLLPMENDAVKGAWNLYNQHMLSGETQWNVPLFSAGLQALKNLDGKRKTDSVKIFKDYVKFFIDHMTPEQFKFLQFKIHKLLNEYIQ